MRITSNTVLDTGHAVQGYMDVNATTLTAVVSTGVRAQLDAAVAALEGHGSTLESQKQQGVAETGKKQQLCLAVIAQMRSIRRFGALALPAVPDFSPLRIPTRTAPAQRVIEMGDAMVDATTPHADALIAVGAPSDFITRLTTAIAAVTSSQQSRAATGTKRVTATGGTAEQAIAVRKAVRAIDGQIAIGVTDPALLTAWKSAKRYRVARSATPATPATPAKPVTPSTSTPSPAPAATATTSSTPAATTSSTPSTTPTEAETPKAA